MVHKALQSKILLIGLSFLLFLGVVGSFAPAQAAPFTDQITLVLYDAASGSIPDSSMLGFTAFPPEGASRVYENGGTVLDTTLAGTDTYAGWVASAATTTGFPILDSSASFQVNFTLQLESEVHESSNRSGLSIILLDQNAKGIEMSFWQNEIWIQSDGVTGGLFTHGESVAFDTSAAPVEYQIAVIEDTYTLTGNSQLLLTGPVRDYSAFDRFPDPYETPNFLFMGDDTTSAQSRIRLRFLSVTGTQSVLPTSAATSTGPPQPTVTAAAPPGATPFPTPVPANPTIDLCPSGWLLGVVMAGNILIIKKTRLTSRNH